MQLRPNTSAQRRAPPLFSSYLTDELADYNSPNRKISKRSDAKRIKSSAQIRKSSYEKQHRSAVRLTTVLFAWGTFFFAHTVQYSTVNKQQLPAFERGAAFIFKYQVVTSGIESQVQLFTLFPNLPDVNLDGVHAILLEIN